MHLYVSHECEKQEALALVARRSNTMAETKNFIFSFSFFFSTKKSDEIGSRRKSKEDTYILSRTYIEDTSTSQIEDLRHRSLEWLLLYLKYVTVRYRCGTDFSKFLLRNSEFRKASCSGRARSPPG